MIDPEEKQESHGVDIAEIGAEVGSELAVDGLFETAGDLIGGVLDVVSIDI
ncbi:MAG: hypothetical protein IPO41_14440 [Acidobacteria bacterium]|jgi:hypothetical protein|nr:hypothetical protein [Acidobacteriota bacterium]MBP7475844.1 hypothetical protein [Pyrinomonadaceae bacterium]